MLLYRSVNTGVLIRNQSIWSYQCGQLILNVFLQEGIKKNSGLDAVWLLQCNCTYVLCMSSLYKNGSNKVKNTIKIEYCWNTSDIFCLMQLQISTKKGHLMRYGQHSKVMWILSEFTIYYRSNILYVLKLLLIR